MKRTTSLETATKETATKKNATSSKSPRKKKLVTFLVIILLAVIFVLLIFLVTHKKKTEAKEDFYPSVVIQKPVYKNIEESITISGYIEANAMIPVVPFVAGTITEYPICAGDFVKKDQILAKIDDAPFRQQYIQARAAYLATESSFKRVEALYKSGSATQQTYDTTKAQYDASKAQYELAKLQLDYTKVKAPVDGTVLIADMAVGSIGNQQQPVAILADLSDLVVRLKVPEKYFDLFVMERKNLVVTVTRPAEKSESQTISYEDAVCNAKIKNIAPYVSPESKNFQVVCQLDSSSSAASSAAVASSAKANERFRPGMFVKVKVSYKTYQNVPTLPMTTKKMDGSCYIFENETSSVKFVPPFQSADDGENFIVPDEYKDCYFVVDGQNFVYDGQKVKLFEQALQEALDEVGVDDKVGGVDGEAGAEKNAGEDGSDEIVNGE